MLQLPKKVTIRIAWQSQVACVPGGGRLPERELYGEGDNYALNTSHVVPALMAKTYAWIENEICTRAAQNEYVYDTAA